MLTTIYAKRLQLHFSESSNVVGQDLKLHRVIRELQKFECCDVVNIKCNAEHTVNHRVPAGCCY